MCSHIEHKIWERRECLPFCTLRGWFPQGRSSLHAPIVQGLAQSVVHDVCSQAHEAGSCCVTVKVNNLLIDIRYERPS